MPVPEDNAPLNGMMILVWAFAWIALVLDVMDWQMVSVSSSLILQEFGMSSAAMGYILGGPLLGAGIGGLISGILSDKFGRVTVMVACLIWYSVFTVAFAWANSFASMVILRVLVGIGLGAQWGIGNTLVAESLPAKMRIMCSAVIQTGFAFGPIVASQCARVILPNYGWRPLFYVGAIGFVLAIFAKFVIPETEMWVKSKEKAKATGTKLGDVKFLFSKEIHARTGTSLRRNTIGVLCLVLFTLLGYWSAMSWIPNWLVAERGMDIIRSMNYITLLNVGGIFGFLVFAFIADRWGRKMPAYVALVASFVTMIVFVNITEPSKMLMFAPVYAFVTYPIFGLYGGYMSELFPTEVRATGVNGIYNFSRMCSFFGPSILGGIAATTSFTFAIGSSAFLYLVALVPLFFLPETIRKKKPGRL